MAATLADVASRAGVSRQTVSNTINSPGIVNERTRSRVLAVIDELDYRPNEQARRLRMQTSHTIGIRLDPMQHAVHGVLLDRFLHAVTDQAASRGRHILVFTSDEAEGEVTEIRALAKRSLADEFIITSTHHNDTRVTALTATGTPFVAFGRPWDASTPDHAWVDVDGSAGTREAVEALVAAGAERVGFLGWPAGSGAGDDRRSGWQQAVEATGGDTTLQQSVEDDPAEAAAGAAALIDSGVDSIVCASDTLAAGAIGVLMTRDASMPVVGFDNTALAVGLGFSSVDQNLSDVAAAVLDVMPEPRATTFDHRLILPSLAARTNPRWGLDSLHHSS